MSSEGKGIDSREKIWARAFAAFGNSPIFGAYSEIRGENGAYQMHNSHVDVLVSYGVLPFVIMVVILSKIMLDVNKKIYSTKQRFIILHLHVLYLSAVAKPYCFLAVCYIYLPAVYSCAHHTLKFMM